MNNPLDKPTVYYQRVSETASTLIVDQIVIAPLKIPNSITRKAIDQIVQSKQVLFRKKLEFTVSIDKELTSTEKIEKILALMNTLSSEDKLTVLKSIE